MPLHSALTWASVHSAADAVISVVLALLLVLASGAAALIVVGAWRDGRRRRIVVEDVIDASGDPAGGPRCRLVGHRLQTLLARDAPKASQQLKKFVDQAASTSRDFGLRFESDEWLQAAGELSSRLAEPSDLVDENLSLVQSLAPEKVRPAVALVSATLVRPRGVRVAATLVVDDANRDGFAITLSDLRGRLPRRRLLLWAESGIGGAPGAIDLLTSVAARCASIECVRSTLLAHAPRSRGMRRPDPGRTTHYVAVTRFLCGRLFFGSARSFPGYTTYLLQRAIEEYESASELEESSSVDVNREPLVYWRALAEGEVARRESGEAAAVIYDDAIEHCRQAVYNASLRGQVPPSWEVSLTTLMLLRCEVGRAPSWLAERVGLETMGARNRFSALLADPDAAYESACLFARTLGTEWAERGDLDRSCVALGAAAILQSAVPLSASQDLDLAPLRANGWVHYLATVVVPQQRWLPPVVGDSELKDGAAARRMRRTPGRGEQPGDRGARVPEGVQGSAFISVRGVSAGGIGCGLMCRQQLGQPSLDGAGPQPRREAAQELSRLALRVHARLVRA